MGKRKFAGTVTGFNHSTESSRYDSSGISAHVRGWDDGIKITAYANSKGEEVFEIHTTGGSNDSDCRTHIATVVNGRVVRRGDESNS